MEPSGPIADVHTDDEVIARVLADCQTWAVVGLSSNTSRAAYRVARFLQGNGKRIVPVHPKAETVHGETGYKTLADVPFPIDCVDVFVRSAIAGDIADQALAVGANTVWFQLGVRDTAAATRVRDAGASMVMDRCPVIEWGHLGPVS